ncbi:MAG TPA: energy-coupling factor ABC transporter permease [Candidatus Syntrophoarchaeum butanivorans]|uniref:Putative cobalt transport protein CbiM n=2 Tax=Candidatus Syntropharchaeum TaxID=1912923 RepID=A0A1F2P314_9EURY|nr:MAG: cobalt transporter CbiM [Candidatus Syntrophoarchaeum butanivorans]OFV67647.1 MAG: cobalt transporter CbiM [Candidatus Syntrophoarchaeum caldarius]HDM36683.1 energy-coupling factor ABC transporter permease [Candidatus Syntrophoarchaeum butanivorans]HEC57833.1 energy-coupling factor ABC transporter permease [Candidatus Syntrophoarchaeum butanivorans]
MHISDGILSTQWCIVWYAVALVFIALGIREIKRRTEETPSYMPLLALMGAAIFVIAVWHIPVPVTGSCSHPIGTPMSAIVVGPFATVVLSAIALIFHAFLAHGGITTLGANTVSMGIVGTFTGYGTYVLLRRANLSVWIAAGMAGFVGDILCYLTTAMELALSINPGSVLYHWGLYSLGFVPTQLPLAVAEFIFTAAIVKYIADTRPDIIAKLGGAIDG